MFVGLPPQRWERELKAAVWSEAGSACPQGSLSKVPALIWRLEQVLSSSTQKKDAAILAVGASAESSNTQKRVFGGQILGWYKWKNTYALFNGAGAYHTRTSNGILSFLVYCALQKCQRGWVTNWTSFYLLKCRQIIFPCTHSWNVFASDSKLWMTSGCSFQCTVWSSWHSSPSVGADWEHAAASGRDAKYMRRAQAQNSCQEDLWEKFYRG